MLEAANSMANQSYLQPRDIALVQAWIADLQALGYHFPAVARAQPPMPALVSSPSPPPSAAAWMDTNGHTLDGAYLFPRQWCTRLDTVLVINIDRIGGDRLEKQMRLLHATYRPHYRRVLFAGSEATRWVQPNARLQQVMDQGYFLNCGNYSTRARDVGFFTYGCVAEGVLAAQQAVWRPDRGMEMANMFYINDDVVFSPCMAQRLNHTKIWYPSNLTDRTNFTATRALSWPGWWWDTDVTGRGLTTRQAITNAFGSAWGKMASLVAGRVQPVQVTHNNNQGDMYFVPARHMQMFSKLAAHFQSHWVMSEAAVPNVLSLIIEGPKEVEVVGLATAWGGGVECFDEGIKQVLPLGADISQARVRACGATIFTDEAHSKLAGLFAMHPVKMANANVSDHFLSWWLSQECTS
jgi:hypothetical protein